MELKITVNLEVEFNEVTKIFNIKDQNTQIQTLSKLPLKMKRKLGVAEIRYGIFTLGSKSIIGQTLPQDTDICVIYNGNSYPAHTHKTSIGRIDRLSSLTRNFHVGTCLTFEYDASKNELTVDKTDEEPKHADSN